VARQHVTAHRSDAREQVVAGSTFSILLGGIEYV
jgi:hypothetical protein